MYDEYVTNENIKIIILSAYVKDNNVFNNVKAFYF